MCCWIIVFKNKRYCKIFIFDFHEKCMMSKFSIVFLLKPSKPTLDWGETMVTWYCHVHNTMKCQFWKGRNLLCCSKPCCFFCYITSTVKPFFFAGVYCRTGFFRTRYIFAFFAIGKKIAKIKRRENVLLLMTKSK